MTRTHVILSDEILRAVDKKVGERGRSRFLEQAAREKLEREELQAALVRTSGAIDLRQYPEWQDSESVAAWVREVRGHEDR